MDNIERLLLDVKHSLEREIRGLEQTTREGLLRVHEEIGHVNTRLETQATRLDRHAGLWQTGSRWSGRMDVWAEKVDAALETKDREIAELRARLTKVEQRPGA
jgi:hypothetical protein